MADKDDELIRKLNEESNKYNKTRAEDVLKEIQNWLDIIPTTNLTYRGIINYSIGLRNSTYQEIVFDLYGYTDEELDILWEQIKQKVNNSQGVIKIGGPFRGNTIVYLYREKIIEYKKRELKSRGSSYESEGERLERDYSVNESRKTQEDISEYQNQRIQLLGTINATASTLAMNVNWNSQISQLFSELKDVMQEILLSIQRGKEDVQSDMKDLLKVLMDEYRRKHPK